MLQRTVARFSLRRSQGVHSAIPQVVSYGKTPLGTAYPGEAGADGKTVTAPESVQDTKASVMSVFTPPTRRDIIEAIGYPGQRHFCGGIVTVGRINYGPGRYDYGRPVMPKGWFANFFYGFWEFGHVMLVSDKWIFLRQVRHIVATLFCAAPFMLTEKWNKANMEADP
mmetsp:Transcript_63127/g.150495  ORF Transcript_63127/g.150495 Transcript_63127/m.150495 type:complete len:168 (+) Transcript_63127:91-594(+)